jgi:hypothetical protein
VRSLRLPSLGEAQTPGLSAGLPPGPLLRFSAARSSSASPGVVSCFSANRCRPSHVRSARSIPRKCVFRVGRSRSTSLSQSARLYSLAENAPAGAINVPVGPKSSARLHARPTADRVFPVCSANSRRVAVPADSRASTMRRIVSPRPGSSLPSFLAKSDRPVKNTSSAFRAGVRRA